MHLQVHSWNGAAGWSDRLKPGASWRLPKHLGHLPPLFLGDEQGAGSDVEQAGFEPAYIGYAGIEGMAFFSPELSRSVQPQVVRWYTVVTE